MKLEKKLDEGFPIFNLGYEGGVEVNLFFDSETDNDMKSTIIAKAI